MSICPAFPGTHDLAMREVLVEEGVKPVGDGGRDLKLAGWIKADKLDGVVIASQTIDIDVAPHVHDERGVIPPIGFQQLTYFKATEANAVGGCEQLHELLWRRWASGLAPLVDCGFFDGIEQLDARRGALLSVVLNAGEDFEHS